MIMILEDMLLKMEKQNVKSLNDILDYTEDEFEKYFGLSGTPLKRFKAAIFPQKETNEDDTTKSSINPELLKMETETLKSYYKETIQSLIIDKKVSEKCRKLLVNLEDWVLKEKLEYNNVAILLNPSDSFFIFNE
eukprot:UN13869